MEVFMHQALYRKWRPRTFDDVYGQEHITSVLKYEIENNKLSHAYLFCGSRGVGKTTCAKILAKAVNCEAPVDGEPCGKCAACLSIESGSATDVIEMDAASNNGVDNIRNIRDEVVFAPAMLKYKVYIVDEVHMLSQSAFNALLKTLEEPPSYVIFILATTEQHKLLPTIISRCQRFEFRRITTDVLSSRLNLIAREEGIDITPDAAHLISRLSQGGMRDAISLLELCAGNNETITEEIVNDTVGSTGRERTLNIATAVSEKDYDTIFDEIEELVRSSKSISVFLQDMISFWRDMLIFKTTPSAEKYLDLTDAETEQMARVAGRFTRETLLWQCRLLDDALPKIIRSNATARMTAELTLMRLCDERLDDRTDALLSRISRLEEKLIGFEPSNVTVTTTEKSLIPPVAAEKTAATAPKKQEIKKEIKKDLEPTEKAPDEEVPEKLETDSSLTGKKRVLRPLRAWVEILEEMAVSDIFLWLDLNTTKAFTDENGNVVVVFDGDFMLERALAKKENISRLADFISKQLGKKTEVTFELLPTEESGDTVIDEILDNFNS